MNLIVYNVHSFDFIMVNEMNFELFASTNSGLNGAKNLIFFCINEVTKLVPSNLADSVQKQRNREMFLLQIFFYLTRFLLKNCDSILGHTYFPILQICVMPFKY